MIVPLFATIYSDTIDDIFGKYRLGQQLSQTSSRYKPLNTYVWEELLGTKVLTGVCVTAVCVYIEKDFRKIDGVFSEHFCAEAYWPGVTKEH